MQEAGEVTSPIRSFLHTFVMILNMKLSAESDIWYRRARRHRIALTYLLIYYHCLINRIILSTHNVTSCFIYEYTQF